MKAVILCGGQGTRLKEETEFKPKPLVEIGGMPILWHIMKTYAHHGIKDFVLCLGYKGDLIKQYFLNYEHYMQDFTLNLRSKYILKNINEIEDWNITFANTGLKANTGARVKRIEKYINEDDFFLTYGDGVSDININELYKFHKNHNRIGTVTAVKPLARFGFLEVNDNIITNFTKKNIVHEGWIDGGFFTFKKEFFDYLKDDDGCILEEQPLQNIAKNNQFTAFKHPGFWQCMDTLNQVAMLNQLWNNNNPPWKVWQDVQR